MKQNSAESLKARFAKGYEKCGLLFQYFLHKHLFVILAIIVTLLSLAVRYSVALHPTRDVVGYVFEWMKSIRDVGFKNFYTVDSDYSPLFLFTVGIFTLLPTGNEITVGDFTFWQNWMYYVKTLYFAAELAIAVGIYLVIKHVTGDKKSAIIGYCAYLCLPVQLFNSAVWGNCDTLYFLCFIYVIYSILKRKDFPAFFLIGVCFGIKLQAVFILPFVAYMTVSGKLKLYKIVALPLGLFATFIPAYICGASFLQPFTFFSKQLGGYSLLSLGCANIWHLINLRQGAIDEFNKGAVLLGLLLIGLFTAIVFARKIVLNEKTTVFVCVFLVGIVPMFLPHMHERYFYALEVLALVYCLIKKRHYFLVVLTQLSGGIAYHNYLAGRFFIQSWGEDSVHIAAWINIAVLCFIFTQLMTLPREGTPEQCAEGFKKRLDQLK